MRSWSVAAVVLLAAWAAGCGGNSTPVGVTVAPNPATVLLNSSLQFLSNVSGASATTVTWQVCLPATTTSGITPPPVTTKPTDCTPIPGVPTPKGGTVLTGYGTVQQNGLYTAPPALPTPNTAVILVTSTVDSTAFAMASLTIESGISVQVTPPTATIGPLESFQFTATVKGPTNNTGVSWTLSLAGNNNPPALGTITPAGLYTAPGASPGVVTVTATSAADPTQSGSALVSISSGGAPTFTSVDPGVAAQGSAQQDVYLTGTNFESTSQVVVTAPNQLPTVLPASSVFFLSTTLLRATLPASVLSAAGSVSLQIQSQTTPVNVSAVLPLSAFAVGPALIAVSPESVSQNSASASVGLTGGYFSSATTATVNGSTVAPVFNSSRQLSAAIPSGVLATPGLYPIVVQNSGVAAGQSYVSAMNVAVTPAQASIPGAPNKAPIGVGSDPSAVAMDEADGIAVVANAGDGSVTLVNVTSDTTVGGAITVGKNPTGVAVDDLLPDPVAVVVNNADQTVTAIDLTTRNTMTLSVSISSGTNPPLPYSVGANPLTHRAIVAYQSSSLAMILDVSDSGGAPGLTKVQTIGGSSSNFTGTGATPGIAVDPRLNWAVVTPGGAGGISVVDLGVDASPSQPEGRSPYAVANLLLSQTVQGVAIDPETHNVFFSDPNTGTLYTFTALDNTVEVVTLPSTGLPGSGGPYNQAGFGAAAASSLEDVGIAVNKNSTAVVVDLANGIVLQTVGGLGASTAVQAVAVDPASNQAVVVNHEGGTVTLLSLGATINSLQITEASPAVVYGGPGTANTTLTILGGGFVAGTSEVLLDGIALPGGDVNVVSSRKIVATVPGSMLDSARLYAVQVQNGAGGAAPVSNVSDLSVIQSIAVGSLPVGVAVDTDRDAAVVTNSGDGTVSLISLAPISSESPQSLGNVGIIRSPVLAGTTPEGVAVLPRMGLAVVANNGSNNATVVDLTGVAVPQNIGICSTGCSGPAGAAMNQDSGIAAIADTNPTGPVSTGTVSFLDLSATPASAAGSLSVDHDPVAVAVDPNLNYAAVTTASQASSINLVNMATFGTVGTINTALENPSGIVFDPVNQIFLTANSLLNDIILVDPTTFIETPVNVGIAPTSIDYNFQTSTLVTANSPSGTLSVLDYVCPPGAGAPAACVGPKVRTVLELGGTQTSPLVLGPNAVAIDPKLNMAVLVDPDNNRVLLVPLPH
ncbi:MAG: beta strand repeat-containing protein [Candidatus Acidiferrales bacterium]